MRLTGVQSLALIVGICVSFTVLLSAAVKAFNLLKRIDSAIGVDEDGKTLRQNFTDMKGEVTDLKGDVAGLKSALDNGIRTDIRSARDHADQARQLAGRAAAASSVANQHAEDAIRATNALRAEVNALTDVAMRDHKGIWRALRTLGIDRRQYDDPDDDDMSSL